MFASFIQENLKPKIELLEQSSIDQSSDQVQINFKYFMHSFVYY